MKDDNMKKIIKSSQKKIGAIKIVGLLLFLSMILFLIKSSFGVHFSENEKNTINVYSDRYAELNGNEYDFKKEPGSYKLTKTAKWVDSSTIEVDYDLQTEIMAEDEENYVIFVIDASASMNGDKINNVKDAIRNFADSFLPVGVTGQLSEDRKIAIISFNNSAQTLLSFSNNSSLISDKLDEISIGGQSNAALGLREANFLLDDNQIDTNINVVIISDGFEGTNLNSGITEYSFLKYNGSVRVATIKYETNESADNIANNISDESYSATIENIGNVIVEAAVQTATYTNFSLTDIYNSEFDYSNSVVSANIGEVSFNETNGQKRLVWSKGLDVLKTGKSLHISAIIKVEGVWDEQRILNITTNTNISANIDDFSENAINSEILSLANYYQITYDTNPPTGCNIKEFRYDEEYAFKVVTIDSSLNGLVEPVCSGYTFRGWKIVDEDVTSINNRSFIMPGKDVIVRATWSKLTLNKMMADGIVGTRLTLFNAVKKTAENGTRSGIINGNGSEFSDIYYLQYHNENNNVIFANYCWLIVRTTDTGGVKLLYNGVPNNGKCVNRNGYLPSSNFNSQYLTINNLNYGPGSTPAGVGYMYNRIYPKRSINMDWAKIIKNIGYSSNQLVFTNIYPANLNAVFYENIKKEGDGTYTLSGESIDIGSGQWAKDDNPKNKYNYELVEGMYTCLKPSSDMNSDTCTNPHYFLETNRERYSFYNITIEENIEDAKIVIGKKVQYNDNKYTLIDTKTITINEMFNNFNYYNLIENNHYNYICPKYNSGVCDDTVYYMGYMYSYRYSNHENNNNQAYLYYYYTPLSNGETYEDLVDQYAQDPSKNYIFGKSVSYENGLYSLQDTISFSPVMLGKNTREDSRASNAQYYDKDTLYDHHYLCADDNNNVAVNTSVCSKVFYIFYSSTTDNYRTYSLEVLQLADGNNMKEAIIEMTQLTDDDKNSSNYLNKNNSTIKDAIDTWYQNHMTNYTKYLEDVVWCNNRSLTVSQLNDRILNSAFNENGGRIGYSLTFNYNSQIDDELACPNKIDRFTVENTKGNQDLVYPVGMLTYGELSLIKFSGISDNISVSSFYSLTPSSYSSYSNIYYLYNYSSTYNESTLYSLSIPSSSSSYYVRPSISLKKGIQYYDGDGTMDNPYLILAS